MTAYTVDGAYLSDSNTSVEIAGLLTLEGFAFGFLGNDADPLEYCAFSLTNLTLELQSIVDIFALASNKTSVTLYYKGFSALFDFFNDAN